MAKKQPKRFQPRRYAFKGKEKFMGACDVCSKNLRENEGYLLTTEQVVSTPAYWDNVFSDSLSQMFISRGPEYKVRMAKEMVSQKTPWMVCDNCIKIFDNNPDISRDSATKFAIEWYNSGGSFAPPNSGAVPLSKANFGDGKVYKEINGKILIEDSSQQAGYKRKISGIAYYFLITTAKPEDAVAYLEANLKDYGHSKVNPLLGVGAPEIPDGKAGQ